MCILLAIDLIIPLGVAFGISYLIVILITFQVPNRSAIIIVAGMSTIFILLGLAFSPEGSGEAWSVYFNRGLSIFAVWIISILGLIKLANEKLKHTESQFNRLIEWSPYCIHQIDTDKKIISMNPAGLRMIEETEESSILGVSYLDLISEKDVKRISRLMDTAFRGSVEEFEFSGTGGLEFHSNFVPICDDRGKVVQLLGITQNITEHKCAENELRRYQHIFFCSSGFLSYMDKNYRYLAVNNFYLETFNQTREEFIGKNAEEIFGDENFKKIKPYMKRCLSGEAVNYETSLNFPAKGTRLLDVHYDPHIGNNGSVEGIIINVRDITERKQAEDALKDSEYRYQYLFEDSPVSLWEEDFSEVKAYLDMLKTKGISDFREYFDENPDELIACAQNVIVLDINKATLTLFQAEDKEELLGNLDKTFTEKSFDVFKEELIMLAEGRTKFESEAEVKTLFGQLRNIHLRFSLTQAGKYGNDSSRALVAISDITERKQAEEALTTSEIKFRTLFNSTNDAVTVSDEERFIDCNRATLRLFGCSTLEEFCANTVADLSPSEQPCGTNSLTLAKQQIALAKEKGSNHFEWMHKRLDTGEIFYADVLLSSFTIDKKKLLQATVRNISERKKAEDALRLSARVFSETNEGITITDAKGIIIDVNNAFCDITGYSREEAIGKSPNFLSSGKQSPEFYADMWQTINEQGHWQGEVWNRKKEGEVYAELLTISSILDDDGDILNYVGLFSDITHSKQQQETLIRMAHYDVLTQLPNRVLLADRFIQAMAHSKRKENLLAVCFLDLDNFKPVNDNYSHEIGDQLLIEVAGRIKANIRDEDTVSRLGGDEFVLLLGDIESFSQSEHMLKRIVESLAQPYFIDENLLSISASIGVSLYPTDNSDLDTLMRHADQAMYQAKLAGRNRYSLFNAEQDQQTIQKNIRLQQIEQALSNDEFCLYYQPKVNMATGKVFGAEALIRWNHPEKGLIPPLKFLPIIEGTELEIQIGNWVINEALKQLKEWKDQGLEFEVSVNISSYHLLSPSFVSDLETTLATYPTVDSTYFQLEILESTALGDLQTISSIIKNCIEALGVNIALDDFGTGYSSLTHLRNLPAHTIKIDKTFVRDVLDDPNDYAIIEGVLGLANAFNREVIAEGVETTEQGLMLLLMGCNEAQGYGISRPLPANDILNWFNNYIPTQEWIAYSNKVLTSKDDKIEIYKLVLNWWLKQFENNIQSSVDSTKYWPIMDQKQCFCSYWLKRARQEQIFEEHWLEKLDEIHNSIHRIAGNLLNKYLQGEIDSARDSLKEIRKVFEEINAVLGQSK